MYVKVNDIIILGHLCLTLLNVYDYGPVGNVLDIKPYQSSPQLHKSNSENPEPSIHGKIRR